MEESHEHLTWEEVFRLKASENGWLLRDETIMTKVRNCAICERMVSSGMLSEKPAVPFECHSRNKRTLLASAAIVLWLTVIGTVLRLSSTVSVVHPLTGMTRKMDSPYLIQSKEVGHRVELRTSTFLIGYITLYPHTDLKIHSAHYYPGTEARSEIELLTGKAELTLLPGRSFEVNLISGGDEIKVEDGEDDNDRTVVTIVSEDDDMTPEELLLKLSEGDLQVSTDRSNIQMVAGDEAQFIRDDNPGLLGALR